MSSLLPPGKEFNEDNRSIIGFIDRASNSPVSEVLGFRLRGEVMVNIDAPRLAIVD